MSQYEEFDAVLELGERFGVVYEDGMDEAVYRERVADAVEAESPVLAQEVAVGKNWKDWNEFEQAGALLRGRRHTEKKRARNRRRGDTHSGMSFDEFDAHVQQSGFERVLAYDDPEAGSGTFGTKQTVIYADTDHGWLMEAHTFEDMEGFNDADVYGELAAPVDASEDEIREGYREARTAWNDADFGGGLFGALDTAAEPATVGVRMSARTGFPSSVERLNNLAYWEPRQRWVPMRHSFHDLRKDRLAELPADVRNMLNLDNATVKWESAAEKQETYEQSITSHHLHLTS